MRRHLRRFLLLLLPAVAVAAAWWVLPWCIPLPEKLLAPLPVSTRYLSHDGKPLRQLLTADGERVSQSIPLTQIPETLIHATLAAEDKRFWDHGGIDVQAIARAARDNLTARRIVSGASTIHQQLIKITAERSGKRTLWVKLTEAIQARHLAMSWSREQVLEAYLNRLPYGNLFVGCATASQGYFNKPWGDLSPAECALLAALPQAPGRFNPFRDLESIRPRQQRILAKMRDLGWLEPEEEAAALTEVLRLQRFTGGFAAPHAIDMLRGAPAPSGDVRTTLDAALQQRVETIITQRLSALKARHVTQAAAVVIENATGKVLALAGSRDFFASDGGQINGAWAPHSPGSAMKPFTYALAFERGLTAATVIADLPVEYGTPTGTYRPENYAHRLYGPVTCRTALGNSLNISAVRVLQQIGGAATLLPKLRDLGLTTLTEKADHYGLGLTIGNAPVRLIELTNAYACLARLGLDHPWSLLADAPKVEGVRKLGEGECYVIADILSDNQARLLTFGQSSPLRLPFLAAVKTGTSTNYRDNWTVGYTPEFTVGVWAGNFDNSPMQDVSGVTGAAPIWREIMLQLQHDRGVTWFKTPSKEVVVTARIDPRTGRRLTPQSPPARMSREEWFLPGNLPPPASASDYDAQGRALLPQMYTDWIKSGDNWLGDLVTTTTKEARAEPLQILNPIPGTVVRLDPDIRNSGNRLLLQANSGSTHITWSSPTLEIIEDAGHAFAILKPGRHQIEAKQPATNQTARTFVIVHEE